MFTQSLKMMWRRRRQNIFLLIELFLSFLILYFVTTFLLIQWNQYKQPLGFDPKNIGEVGFSVNEMISVPKDPETGKQDSVSRAEALQNFKRELEQIEGLSVVTLGSYQMPFKNSHWTSDQQTDEDGFLSFASTQIIQVDENFNDIYELPLITGSWYARQPQGKYLGAAANEKFFEENYDGEQKLGGLFRMRGKVFEVQGIVEQYKFDGEFSDEEPALFLNPLGAEGSLSTAEFRYDEKRNPHWQKDVYEVAIKYFGQGSFSTEIIDDRRRDNSRRSWIMIFGLATISLFLIINVSIGLFGALQYSVQQRRGEIGLRKAMGASKGKILGQFIVELIILSTFAVGLALILAVQVPLLHLFEVDNKTAYEAIGLTLGFVYAMIFICSLIPANRAASVVPAVALHDE